MKNSRKVWKGKVKNQKAVADAIGDDIIFPDLEEGDNYGVGDKVELTDDKNPTFERVMPDGSIIKVENGVLKDIIEAEMEEETEKAQKVFNCTLSSKRVEIFGSNPEGPFIVGNKINVNGNADMRIARVKSGNIEIFVYKGKISSVRSIPTSRSVFKNSDSLEKMKTAVAKKRTR